MKDLVAGARPMDSSLVRRRSAFLPVVVGSGILLALIFVAGLSFMQGASDRIATDNSDAPVVTVNTIVARYAASFQEQRSFTGIVKAGRTSELSFSQGGRVIRLLVQEGDAVQTGQPLASLDLRRLELKKTRLADALATAKSALSRLAPETLPLTPIGMQARLRELRAELNQLEADVTSRTRALNRQPNNQSLTDRLQNVERQLALLDEKSRRQQIDAQTKLVSELEGQLKDAELELEGDTLLAPYAGIVALRHINEGTVVSAGMPIVSLVELKSLEAWVGIPVETASKIALGEKVPVTIINQEFEASVRAKLPLLDRTTRTRTIILALGAAAEQRVLPGEVARVQLRTQTATPGVWVPYGALTRESRGLWSVLVVEGEAGEQTVVREYVELLHLAEDRALVRGTLDDGALVIANGVHRVVPGQRVKSNDISSATSSSDSSREPT